MNNKLIGSDYFLHESSYVEDCCIGNGTKIWHFCHLFNSTIGENCNIGQNVMIGPNVRIGDNCKVQNNVSLYDGVTLKSDVFVGPSAVFTNVLNPRSFIDRKKELKPTVIEQGVTIGANATIVCGITIDKYSFIAAGTVVVRSIPSYCLVVGNPGKIIRMIDKEFCL